MEDMVYDAYNDLTNTLTNIKSLLEGAWQITEHAPNPSAVIDLIVMAQEKVDEGRETLKTMFEAHRKMVPKPKA
jgi:hypothetical protein